MRALLWILVATAVLAAQQPPSPANASASAPAGADAVVDDDLLLERIEAACAELRAKGALHTVAQLAQDRDGRRCEVAFAEPSRTPLAPVALRARLCRSVLVVGHYYPCEECHEWHFTASTGFAVRADGVVATCGHLLEDDPGMPGACLAVADFAGRVWPVTEVLAADLAADVVLLQCPATDLVPLSLRTEARAGERIYCLSNPDHQFACFTEGLIARRYVVRDRAPGIAPPGAPSSKPSEQPTGKHGEAARPEHALKVDPKARVLTFLQITCDFAMGSSGAPVVDECGNVVGIAQSTASVLIDSEPDAPSETQMVARSAAPAAALRALAK